MNGNQEFDFLHGQWLVRNRRRRRCLEGSDDWDEFDSLHKCWPLLDGFGNVDEYLRDDRPSGAWLHFFDPQRRRWSMHRVSPRRGMQPPVEGVFRNGVGTFYGETRFDGRPILVRYLWGETQTESPRWEQAFSDDGKTWETRWTMQFTRLDWPLDAGLRFETRSAEGVIAVVSARMYSIMYYEM
ncbi:MAG TPA: hypothetical protein VF200_11865 [Woeseiaceae bacterium]